MCKVTYKLRNLLCLVLFVPVHSDMDQHTSRSVEDVKWVSTLCLGSCVYIWDDFLSCMQICF